jgi:hypothetical protein
VGIAYTLTQQRLLAVLMHMESEVAMGQWSKLLIAEARVNDLLKLYVKDQLWQIIDETCNLRH